jgi:hypothetical protein
MADRYGDATPDSDEGSNGNADDTGSRESGKESNTDGMDVLNRRSLLKTVGVATAGAAATGFSGLGAAATTVNDISFDRVVNAVEDLGMDPNGNDPIDSAFESAIETGTLIEFPPGTYLVTSDHYDTGVSRFGVRGTGSHRNDVVFRPPSGSAVGFLRGGGTGPFTIENVSFDELDDDTSMIYLNLGSDNGVYVKNIEFLGKTPLDDASDYTINADVHNQDAVAIYENVYAGLDQPAVPADYPEGVAFIRAGPSHNGEVVLRNCAIHERNSAATRLTNCSGVTTIEGGEFVNNQNANIRFGAGNHPSKVSSATGTYVKIDGSRSASDAVRLDCTDNGYAGAIFQDLEIEWTKDSGSVITFPDWAGHGRAEFYNCVVRNDGNNAMTVNAESVDTADDKVIIENCAFTGSGKGFDAYDRDGSVIRNSCISMPNASISTFDTENVSTGGCRTPGDDSTQDTNSGPSSSITVVNTDGLTVDLSGADSTDSDGNIASYAWNVAGSSYSGQTVTHTFASSGTYTVELTVTDNDGATDTVTKDLTLDATTYENTLTIKGTGTTTEYAFEVSDALTGINGSIEEWDSVSGSSATGYVTDTTDSDEFAYDGEITSFEFLQGEAEVYRNGTQIDPTQEPNSGPTASITVVETDGLSVALSGADSTDSDGSIAGYNWTVGGSSYSGETATHTFDSGGTYTVELTVEDDDGATATTTKDVTVESASYENTLVIKGTGTTTEYAFEVSGDLQGISGSIEEWDSVSGSSATGYVTDTTDSDEFAYDGEITSFEFVEGEAEVYRNGTRINPTQSRLSIRGTGTVAEYDFAVSGDLDPVQNTIENWDDVSGSSATGFVTSKNDVDEFDITGEFTRFDFLRGDADVYVDGELIDVSTI